MQLFFLETINGVFHFVTPETGFLYTHVTPPRWRRLLRRKLRFSQWQKNATHPAGMASATREAGFVPLKPVVLTTGKDWMQLFQGAVFATKPRERLYNVFMISLLRERGWNNTKRVLIHLLKSIPGNNLGVLTSFRNVNVWYSIGKHHPHPPPRFY